ncbi:PEGA domain-containing protein, partial [Myxococcota bacterium]|nr:PEGA domain-containing protein [Myxococcota bacterium]
PSRAPAESPAPKPSRVPAESPIPKPAEREERTVIDKRMASVLARSPKVERDALAEELSMDTDGRLVVPDLDATPLPAFPDRTARDRPEATEIGEVPSRRSVSVPHDATEELAPVRADDTVDDALTLQPLDRKSSLSPRPFVAGGPTRASSVEPSRPAPAKITVTPSDPRAPRAAEVRVTAADPSLAQRTGSSVKITPSPAPLPDDDRALIVSPSLPAHLLHELEPIEKLREHEMTVLDLGAQLGLAPEKADVVEGSSRGVQIPAPARTKAEQAALRMPLPEQGAKVAELLEEQAEKERERALLTPLQRSETINQHLPGWLRATEGAAKLIPILIAVGVALATIAIVVTLFSRSGTGGTDHVTLRFLPVQSAGPENPSLAPPQVTITTEPAGVLVVLDRKILGPTPLSFELPMKAEKVGVELTSPYFETWIGEVAREPTGEMRIEAKLKRR